MLRYIVLLQNYCSGVYVDVMNVERTGESVLVTEAVAQLLELLLEKSPEGIHAYGLMTGTNRAAGTVFGSLERLGRAGIVHTKTVQWGTSKRTLYFIPNELRLEVADDCAKARSLYLNRKKGPSWRRQLGLPRLNAQKAGS